MALANKQGMGVELCFLLMTFRCPERKKENALKMEFGGWGCSLLAPLRTGFDLQQEEIEGWKKRRMEQRKKGREGREQGKEGEEGRHESSSLITD